MSKRDSFQVGNKNMLFDLICGETIVDLKVA